MADAQTATVCVSITIGENHIGVTRTLSSEAMAESLFSAKPDPVVLMLMRAVDSVLNEYRRQTE